MHIINRVKKDCTHICIYKIDLYKLLIYLRAHIYRAASTTFYFSQTCLFTSGRYDTEVINSARIFRGFFGVFFVFFFLFVSSRARSGRVCGGDDNFR